MVTVLPHMKIAWGGSLGSPAMEVWTNSLAWVPTAGSDITAVIGLGLAGEQANTVGLATAISNWFGSTLDLSSPPATGKGSGISPTAKLEWVKCNWINASGHYQFASNTYFLPAPTPGGGFSGTTASGLDIPWQCSTAITLRTTNPRGRGSKGRIFPPMSGFLPSPNQPYIEPTVVQRMTNAFTGLINNINSGMYMGAAPGYDGAGAAEHHAGNVVIVSTSPATGPHAGAAPLLTPVFSVEIDEVIDTMTSRTNRIPRRISPKQTVTLNL